MTGRPDRPLPDNWNNIPGAKGCTIQTCSFRDNYDEIISLNAVPIGISSQSVDDNKEMTSRLKVPYDVLSDDKLQLSNELNIPTFSVGSKIFLKRITLIVEKKIIKKVFYPINDINKHIEGGFEMVKSKLKYLITILFFISSFAYANPNVDQWMESDKSYKDLINEGFEVKSYAMNTIETANGLYILLFVTVLQKEKELYECQEYQTIDKTIETIDMTLVCKELVQPYERGLGT